jgi:phosphatidate cytidylyltransferase
VLRHRLIAGTFLAAAMGGVLVGDSYLAPSYPFLLACVLAVGWTASRELLALIPNPDRPHAGFCTAAVLAVLSSNWAQLLLGAFAHPSQPVLGLFASSVIGVFLLEMARYRETGRAVSRVAHTALAVAYLGVLPSFFVQLRWLPEHSGLALTLTVFVPKVGDIGAYFTGRFLGRHRFSPLLSPKKTWEGFVGGLLASVLTAVGLSFAGPVFRYGWVEAALFGLAVGLAGVLGDLAESMVKRDAQAKDAAKRIPGFGGVLDVIDSVLFAGPVAYWWLTR